MRGDALLSQAIDVVTVTGGPPEMASPPDGTPEADGTPGGRGDLPALWAGL